MQRRHHTWRARHFLPGGLQGLPDDRGNKSGLI